MLAKTAIFGASGFIGTHLFDFYRAVHPDTLGTGYSRIPSDLTYFDLNRCDDGVGKLDLSGYQSAVISFGETKIHKINKVPEQTYKINVMATLRLIEFLVAKGLHVIFLSSDNVFDGKEGSYTDNSVCHPVSRYGQQKLEVENAFKGKSEPVTLMRLSKIYGLSLKNSPIFSDIYRQLNRRRTVMAAEDLIFNLTHVEDVIRAVAKVQEEKIYGVVNFCAPIPISRYQLTVRLAELLGIDQQKIQRIKMQELLGDIARPLNTSMINSSCFENFEFLDIEKALAAFVQGIKKDES